MINPLLLAGAVGLGAFLLLSKKASAQTAPGKGSLLLPPTVIPAGGGSYSYPGPTYATVNLSEDDVRYIQTELTALGYGPVTADGLLGSDTAAAVRRFQAANGLKVDGIIGPETWNALQNAGGTIVDYTQTSGVYGLADAAVGQAMAGMY